jgi:adenylate cyclase
MKKLILLLTINFIALNCFAQDQHLVDSLEAQLNNLDAIKLELGNQSPKQNDTIEANILAHLSTIYWGNDPKKSMAYAQQCLSLSEQIAYKRGIAKAYHSMAINSGNNGDFLTALQYYNKTMKVWKVLGDKRGIAGCYINSGNMYTSLGDYPKALKYLFTGLKKAEQIGNKQYMANAFMSLGNVYIRQNNYTDALKVYLSSLKKMKEIGNKNGIANCYGNIGNIYGNQGNFHEALKNYLASLKMLEEVGDKIGIALCYNNIGDVFIKQGNHTEGLKNHFASLKIREENADKLGITMSYLNIGDSYTKQKKYKEAAEYLNKGLLLSKEISVLELIRDSYDFFSKFDSAQGNYSEALQHYKFFIVYRDSIENTENTMKAVALQLNYDFDKKEAATKVAQEKKDIKQRNIRNSIAGGLLLSLIFLMVVFRQRNKISKEKSISEKERKRSDELLLNILPAEIAEELKLKGSAEAQLIEEVTVLFTDFKGFTQLSEKLTPKELVGEINECFSAFDHIMQQYGVEKIKTIGDAYMAAGGLPTPNKTHAEDVVKAALEIQNFMHHHKAEKEAEGKLFFEIRIGVHTGPVVAGIVGIKKFAYDIWGDTVNTASRMESSGEIAKVNISGTTYELVKDKFNCIDRGKIKAKGKGEIDMYFVEGKIE